jgi:aspartate aminotransferase
LYSKLIDIGYDCVLPEGAFYLFPKSPIASDEDFVKKLQDNLVLVVPGSGFGKKGYFRISYCVEDSVLEGSIEGFSKVFQHYKNKS